VIWRSSTLGLADETCGKAIDYLIAGVPYYRDRFAVGVAAHACLEAIGRATTANGIGLFVEEAMEACRPVCEELIAVGRSFGGRPEPPLRSSAVWAGRDLAIAYVRDGGSIDPADSFEHVLAVDAEWRPVPADDPRARFMAQIDAVGLRYPNPLDDETGIHCRTRIVRDYKSAHSADEKELGTTQRKMQAAITWAHREPEDEALRIEVVNFRRREIFGLTLDPEEVEPQLAVWRADVESEARAREAVGPDGLRVAAPGAGCIGCPYLRVCEPARDLLSAESPVGEPEELGARYAVHVAEAKRLRELLEPLADEEPITLPDSALLGWKPGEETRVKVDGWAAMAEEWEKRAMVGKPKEQRDAVLAASIPGLLLALRPVVGNANALAKTLFHKDLPEFRAKRESALGRWTYKKLDRNWGVWKP
jgi:hypothetical protein